jgi:cell division protein FtsL
MMTGETVLIVITLVLILLVIGNIVFSKVAERRNPPNVHPMRWRPSPLH